MTFSLPHTNVTNVFGATIITQTHKKKKRVHFNCGKNVIKSTMSVWKGESSACIDNVYTVVLWQFELVK